MADVQGQHPEMDRGASNDLMHVGTKEEFVDHDRPKARAQPEPQTEASPRTAENAGEREKKEETKNMPASDGSKEEDYGGSNVVPEAVLKEPSKAEIKVANKSTEKKRGAKDASNSLAFLMLQKLLEEGKITEEQANRYRSMYERLNTAVVDVYDNETKLYSMNSSHKKELLELKKVMEEKKRSVESLKEACEVEHRKKEQLNKDFSGKQLELKLVDSQLQNYLNQERDKEKQLEEMIKRKEEAVKPLLDDLNAKLREALEEVRIQNENMQKETEAKELYLAEIEKLKATIEDLQRDKHEKRRSLSLEINTPDKIRGESDALSRNRAKKEKEALTLLEDMQKLKAEVEEKESQIQKIKLEVDQHRQTITRHRGSLGKEADKLAQVEKKLEREKQKNIELSERQESVKVEIENQRNRLHIFTTKLKQNHQLNLHEIKRCEKIRRKLDTVNAIIPSLGDQRDLLGIDIKRTKEEIAKIEAQIRELKSDKDVLLYTHLEIEDKEAVTSEALQAAIIKVRAAKDKVEELQKREISLRRTISEWSSKRELQARETSKAITEYRETMELWKVKNMIDRDLDKQIADLLRTVQLREEEYKKIKNIKEKYVNQVQVTDQALIEIREKIQILQHEVQILHQETQIREAAYKEETRNHQIFIQRRMHMREERSTLKSEYKKLKQWQEHQTKEIESLNQVVNSIAKKFKKIKGKYLSAIDQRNGSGMRVIDRNDELSILQEKAKIQHSILSKGTSELRKRDAQVEQLKREVAENSRTKAALLKRTPAQELWYATRKTLESSQKQLEGERMTAIQLSQALATPQALKEDGRTRINKLKGFDPEKDQLQTKIEVLEEKLAEKKEKLVEKDLILHEVSALSDKLCKQAAENRTWTLELAKKINEYQSQIRQLTRAQMATVSELSMYQATALKLEHERKSSADTYDEARARMAEGQAPTDDAEGEWFRLIRERQRQRDLLVSRKKHIKTLMKARPGHLPTRADQRPNAYVTGELGIPKPYGHLAPFKPSVLGSNMRHLRRSVQKVEP